MVCGTRGRPRYAALSGCTNATMMLIASLPGQKIFFTYLSLVKYKFAPYRIVCEGVYSAFPKVTGSLTSVLILR